MVLFLIAFIRLIGQFFSFHSLQSLGPFVHSPLLRYLISLIQSYVYWMVAWSRPFYFLIKLVFDFLHPPGPGVDVEEQPFLGS